jgi:23S rRNA (uracil1939-C5)-methyltransferase
LYAGVGLFSLPLAKRFERVIAVESGAAASCDLEHNAANAGLAIEVHATGAQAFLADSKRPSDLVLADPPRAGLGKPVITRLLELRPATLVIVSCDPSTLARDLASLLAGGYAIQDLTLIDLFPQTYHLETVVRCAGS